MIVIHDRSGNHLHTTETTAVIGVPLKKADFRHIELSNHTFSGCDLTQSRFYACSMHRASFVDCDLGRAEFSYGHLFYTTFTNCDLRGAWFSACTGIETIKFEGCRRMAADEPIPGYKVVDGILVKKPQEECSSCTQEHTRSCLSCDTHCVHVVCGDCNDCAEDGTCEHCNTCRDGCCNCSICYNCTELSACPHGGCDGCENCCACEDAGEHQESHTPWYDKTPKKFKCSRLAGVEWEFNDRESLTSWRTKWRGGVHEDGSCGYEAVTAPLAGDHIAACLRDLGEEFKRLGTGANRDCGIHVHVDAIDLSWHDMYRLLWVYAKVEPLMYLLGGQARARTRNNESYCAPVGVEYLKSLAQLDRKGGIMSVALTDRGGNQYGPAAAKIKRRNGSIGKKDEGRYKGLNIMPWLSGRQTHKRRKDSTVEFRMHRNSMDAERIIGWTQLCVRLVDWCAKASDKDAQELPRSALRALCEVIAPDCAPYILKRVAAWRKATTKTSQVPRYISISKAGYALKEF